jgi:hypothetical protein
MPAQASRLTSTDADFHKGHHARFFLLNQR